MKVVIDNYASYMSTEPMYLSASLSKTECVTPYLWQRNTISAFDILDKTSPDLVFCSHETPSLNDIFKYLSQNTNIELVMNITGIDNARLKLLESIMETKGVKCKAFISNYHSIIQDSTPKNSKLINLLPAHDVFLGSLENVDFHIGAAIVSQNCKDLVEDKSKKYETYHKVFFGGLSQDPFYDFSTTIQTIANIYKNYDEILIADDPKVIFSQLFFEAVVRAKRVKLASNKMDVVNKILDSLFQEDENEDENVSDFIKKQIALKHNCITRTAFLMEQLGNKNAAEVLRRMVKS